MNDAKRQSKFSEELLFSLREIYSTRQSVIRDDDIASLNREVLDASYVATNVKHQSGVRLSRTVPEKSAILLYEFLRHGSTHGRMRRVACVAFLMFLYRHGYWISLPPREFKSLIQWMEGSHHLAQKETIEGARKIILAHIREL